MDIDYAKELIDDLLNEYKEINFGMGNDIDFDNFYYEHIGNILTNLIKKNSKPIGRYQINSCRPHDKLEGITEMLSFDDISNLLTKQRTTNNISIKKMAQATGNLPRTFQNHIQKFSQMDLIKNHYQILTAHGISIIFLHERRYIKNILKSSIGLKKGITQYKMKLDIVFKNFQKHLNNDEIKQFISGFTKDKINDTIDFEKVFKELSLQQEERDDFIEEFDTYLFAVYGEKFCWEIFGLMYKLEKIIKEENLIEKKQIKINNGISHLLAELKIEFEELEKELLEKGLLVEYNFGIKKINQEKIESEIEEKKCAVWELISNYKHFKQ